MNAIDSKAITKIKQKVTANESKKDIKWNQKNSINPKKGRKRRKWEQRTNGTSRRQDDRFN